VGTTAGSMSKNDRSISKRKRNVGCSMSHGAYTVVLLCVFCVVLIVGVPTYRHDYMFGNVLTPISIVSSCLLPSQRVEDDQIAHLQPDQRPELC